MFVLPNITQLVHLKLRWVKYVLKIVEISVKLIYTFYDAASKASTARVGQVGPTCQIVLKIEIYSYIS
jgi:hypothetical protein